MLKRWKLWLLSIIALISLLPAVAFAGSGHLVLSNARLIVGSPLLIYVGDGGSYQMRYVDADRDVESRADGSLYLRYGDCQVQPPANATFADRQTTTWAAQGQSDIEGSGDVLDPWRLTTGLTAVCGDSLGADVLHATSTVNYVEGDDFFRLQTAVCGGRPDEAITLALVTNAPRPAVADAKSTAVLDADGCADFDVIWTFGSEPQAPTSLELVSVAANVPHDQFSMWGFAGLAVAFLGLTAFWLIVMRRPQSGESA